MPVGVVFHIADALALGGVQDDEGGAALFGVEGFHRSLDLVQVVAVDGQHLEAEGLQLFVLGGAVHDFFNGAVDLQMVQVQKDAEIVQLVVGRKHKGLPALALLDLAVAHDGVDPHLIQPLDLGAQGHAAGGGDALAQAAGGHIHAGDGVHIGVALQAAAQLAQGGQLLRGEKAALGQGCIKGRGRMALGKDQPVPLGPGGVGGVDPHLPEVQKGQHLRDGQAAARVAAFGAVGAFDHAKADAAGMFLQGKFFCVCHKSSFHLHWVCLPTGPCWGRFFQVSQAECRRHIAFQLNIIYSALKRQDVFVKMYSEGDFYVA